MTTNIVKTLELLSVDFNNIVEYQQSMFQDKMSKNESHMKETRQDLIERLKE